MIEWTKESLAARTVHERHTIWTRARSRTDPDAKKLVELIEQCGLPYSDGKHVTRDDPLVLRMHDIVNSKEGTEAMCAAVEEGLPPMAGVDPLLSAALGVDYGGHNGTTNWAGHLVWERMRSLGYKRGGQKSLPENCVARSALSVVKPRR